MANIYEKLQQARVDFHNTEMKKTGHNKFAGYFYFELADFLPTVLKVCDKNKIFTNISFTENLATLTVTDVEKPTEVIIFTSPMSKASLKGCHDVQNLGAVETYLRRYLYTTAFEIIEEDALDLTTGKEEEKPVYINRQQALNITKTYGKEAIKIAMKEMGFEKLSDIKIADLVKFDTKIQDIQEGK